MSNLTKIELADGLAGESLVRLDNIEQVHPVVGRYSDDIWVTGMPLDGVKRFNVALRVHTEHQAAAVKRTSGTECKPMCTQLTQHRP